MTSYKQDGDCYRMANPDNFKISEKLPAGTYSLQTDIFGFFFQRIEDFSLPKKIYGSNQLITDRIFKVFLSRNSSTGILLSGQKGSGKTLQTKAIAEFGKRLGIPTIVISDAYAGTGFNLLLQAIDQPCIILIDEVEKVYGEREQQEKLLSLLDGVFPSKKLFLLTCNEPYKLSSYMFNRPGRLFYHITYGSLSVDFVKEFAEDNLANKEKVKGLVAFAKLTNNMNFDMLKAIVEEMNRFDEDVVDAVRFLNVEPEKESKYYNFIELSHDTLDVELDEYYSYGITFDASSNDTHSVRYKDRCPFTDEEMDLITTSPNENVELVLRYNEWNNRAHMARRKRQLKRATRESSAYFSAADLIKSENDGKLLTFNTKDGFTIVIEEQEVKKYSAGKVRRTMYGGGGAIWD